MYPGFYTGTDERIVTLLHSEDRAPRQGLCNRYEHATVVTRMSEPGKPGCD
jgi:hypothetical protein